MSLAGSSRGLQILRSGTYLPWVEKAVPTYDGCFIQQLQQRGPSSFKKLKENTLIDPASFPALTSLDIGSRVQIRALH